MALPLLKDWNRTSIALHKVVKLLGPIRNALFEPANNYLELALQVQPDGLSSGRLPGGGEIYIHFQEGAVTYTRGSGEKIRLGITDHTQASLFKAIVQLLAKDELSDYLSEVPKSKFIPAFIEKLQSDRTKTVFLGSGDLISEDPLIFDPRTAGEYAQALYTVFTAVARFRARLAGHMTPVIVWPEHFDLSTLWFVEPDMNDSKDHINIGFAPYSKGFERPYLYAYAYPYLESYSPPQLPDRAVWNTKDFTGVVVNYDDMPDAEDPTVFIERICIEIFKALRSLLNR
jgi:hypothetical protein